MSEDKILKRRDVGPDLHKRDMREKMSPEQAKIELESVMFWIDMIKEHEDAINNINSLLANKWALFGCTDLNHLLSVLSVRGGGKVHMGVKVIDGKK